MSATPAITTPAPPPPTPQDFARDLTDSLGGMGRFFEGDMGGMGGMLGDMGRFFEGLEPFLGHIQEMVRDLERMQQGERRMSSYLWTGLVVSGCCGLYALPGTAPGGGRL